MVSGRYRNNKRRRRKKKKLEDELSGELHRLLQLLLLLLCTLMLWHLDLSLSLFDNLDNIIVHPALPLGTFMEASMRGKAASPAKLLRAAATVIRHFPRVDALVGLEVVHAREALRTRGERTGERLLLWLGDADRGGDERVGATGRRGGF